jgi:carbamoyl-phosphate synthase large subunit
VVKPRTGRGSRGLGIVADVGSLNEFLTTSDYAYDRLLLQEYVDGIEYTVSVVVWRDGVVQSVVPKEIVLKRGITQIAVTRRIDRIDAICKAVQQRLRGDGPFNVQLRLDRATGEPRIFEINPRFSTTVSLTTAAGVDEVGDTLRQALNIDRAGDSQKWREGMVLLRRTLDSFIDADDFAARQARIVDMRRGAPPA